MSGTTYGLRWGKVKLAETANGSVDLLIEDKRTPYGFRVFQPVYTSRVVATQPHRLGRVVREVITGVRAGLTVEGGR